MNRAKIDLSPLERLQKRQRGIMARAINRAAKPVRAAVVAEASSIKRFGFLAKSIRQKAKIYGEDNHVLIIGPSMAFVKNGKYKDGKPRSFVPWRYANVISSVKSGSRYRPWLWNAFEDTSTAYIAAAKREIARDIAAALK